MCVILSVYQKKKDASVQEMIIKQFEAQRKANKDGIGIVAYNSDKRGGVYTFRELYVDKLEVEQILKEYDVVHIHLRQATTGKVSQDNCHFWQLGEWYFAHNGMVYGDGITSAYDMKEEMTDSFMLFAALVKGKLIQKNGHLKHKEIREYISNIGFWGRFTLLNAKSKKMYYFGDFHAYTLGDNTLVVSTTSLQFKQIYSIYGMPFNDDAGSFKVREVEFEGIYCVDSIKETTKEIHEGSISDEKIGYTGYHASGYTRYKGDMRRSEIDTEVDIKELPEGNLPLPMGEEYAGRTEGEIQEMNDDTMAELEEIERLEEQEEKEMRKQENDDALMRSEEIRSEREQKSKERGEYWSPKSFGFTSDLPAKNKSTF